MGSFASQLGVTWKTAEYTAAQTDTVLIAAPGAGNAIELLGWKWSTDTAMKITLEETANLVDAQHCAVDGSQVVAFSEAVALPANKALTITTSEIGDVAVGVLYRVVTV